MEGEGRGAAPSEEGVTADEKRIVLLTRDRFEGGIDFAPGSGVHDLDLHPHRARAAGRSVEEPTRALANVVMTSTSIRPVTPTSTGVQSRLGPPLVESIRCSSIHFLPKRSFPVSTLEIRLVSGPLAVCDCSCAMAGDSAAITSEAVTPSTRLWEEGRMELSRVGG